MTGAYTREELANLYRRRVGMVYQICLMLLKNVPDAEDATQTVFRKVLERTEPFRDLEHERAWLIVTARGRGGVGGPSLPPREGAYGPLPSLLPGLQHRRDGGAHGNQARHPPHLALPGQRKAETEIGGRRIWRMRN